MRMCYGVGLCACGEFITRAMKTQGGLGPDIPYGYFPRVCSDGSRECLGNCYKGCVVVLWCCAESDGGLHEELFIGLVSRFFLHVVVWRMTLFF